MIAELIQKLRNLAVQPSRARGAGYEADLERRFAALRPNLSPSEIKTLQRSFLGRFSPMLSHLVPVELLRVFQELVKGATPKMICDPWSGIGLVIAAAQEIVDGSAALAITRSESEALVGKILAPEVDWKVGDPLEELRNLEQPIDLALAILPFAANETRSETIRGRNGDPVNIRTDLGGAILLSALAHLSADGRACFVVTSSFFWSARSARKFLGDFGCYLSAVFALPAGMFAPHTQIATNLIVITRQQTDRLFIAQLTQDEKTNAQIIANFRSGTDTGVIESGRYVPSELFRTIEAVRLDDALKTGQRSFDSAPRPLGELAVNIYRRHSRDQTDFDDVENAVFIPLVGNSAVVTSKSERTLKFHNYAQVVINSNLSDARFIAQFLNSHLGQQIREMQKVGGTIAHLNSESINSLPVFVLPLETQKALLEVETRITAEENAVLDLQIELDELRRDLWAKPASSAKNVSASVELLSRRLSGELKQHTEKRLDEWFETLPFPLASILRAWQATPAHDFKAKYEHLLHFFEATAEFFSLILLSAFTSNDALFQEHKAKLLEALREVHFTFDRPTFGTWKLVTEYLGKRTRLLLGGDRDARDLCVELFVDPSLRLPVAVSRTEISGLLSTANKLRNDSAHGGMLGQEEARLLNEQLLGQVQRVRELMADVWNGIQLIQPLGGVEHRGIFQNDFKVLMGSNSEFLTETRQMVMSIDTAWLYMTNKNFGKALRLLPLLRCGSSPPSANNACYFFNRLDRNRARFISYHYKDRPELTGQFDEVTETIKLLTV